VGNTRRGKADTKKSRDARGGKWLRDVGGWWVDEMKEMKNDDDKVKGRVDMKQEERRMNHTMREETKIKL